jgi:uncharacterized membrane protein
MEDIWTMNIYPVLKLIHVMAAIVAVGFNLSYIIWFIRGKRETQYLAFSLKGIRMMDNWVANPSYIVSLVTGLLLCFFGRYNLIQVHWILYSLILFGIMGVVGFGIYAPSLKNQITVLEEKGFQSIDYKRADKKQTIWGVVLFLLALFIVAMMVIKP